MHECGLQPQKILPLAVFVVVLACGLAFLQQSRAIKLSEAQQAAQQILVAQKSELSQRLSYTLSSTYFLAQEVARSEGKFENFDEYAQSVIQRMEGISNLQLAPNGVISRIFPLAGNESAIGHDILKNDSRKEDAIEAIESRKLTLAGPFELIQGGIAVIGRNPVFLQQPDGSDKFWGFVSALILVEDLVGGSGLSSLSTSVYAYELSHLAPETGSLSVFSTSGNTTDVDMQSIELVVPNGTWILRIGMLDNGSQSRYWLEALVVFLIALLVAVVTLRISNEPELLRQKVEEQTKDLNKLAYYDALTSLPNRHQFNEALRKGLEKCANSKIGIALLLLDLDNFKEVNDTLGHDMGDLLLIEAGERISKILPQGALLARLGGDEFTVIITHLKYSELAEQASKDIIQVIGEPFKLNGSVCNVTASVGIASASEQIMQPGELLKCADQAMYEVKRSGRSGFIHFSESILQETAQRSQLINDLRLATQDGSLQLLFQPIISSNTGQAYKAEALLRWHHPELGTISPAVFIPLAEESGLIFELGDWVFNEAVRQAGLWRKNYDKYFQISVNVSPLQFRSKGQIQRFIKTANAKDFEPQSVLIEITEGVLMENNNDNVELVSSIKNAGFQIALDDFGTGYSSLSYLKMLDIDYLKIDRAFVQSLTADSTDLILCKAILSIAEGMAFDVVAEGVETKEQEELLRSIGCQYLQGFLYSKPITAPDFEAQFFGSARKQSIFERAA